MSSVTTFPEGFQYIVQSFVIRVVWQSHELRCDSNYGFYSDKWRDEESSQSLEYVAEKLFRNCDLESRFQRTGVSIKPTAEITHEIVEMLKIFYVNTNKLKVSFII